MDLVLVGVDRGKRYTCNLARLPNYAHTPREVGKCRLLVLPDGFSHPTIFFLAPRHAVIATTITLGVYTEQLYER